MRSKKTFLSALLIFTTWVNALPAAARPMPAKDIAASIKILTDPSEIFAVMKKDDGVFTYRLAKMNGGDADAGDALEAQGVYFYDRLREDFADQLTRANEKASEAVKKKYEQLRNVRKVPVKTGPVKPVPVKKSATIKYDNPAKPTSNIFRNASYSSADDSPDSAIKKVETDTSVTISGAETKTIDTPDISATRTASGNSSISFDGKKFSIIFEMGEKLDASSKTGSEKATREWKITWNVSLDACPDAEGIVRGTGRAHILAKTTINTGRDLAALSLDTEVIVSAIGYVNDDARMTHWDMEGSVSEKAFGFDRAVDHGLATDNGVRDGKIGFTFEAKDGTPPTASEDPQTRQSTREPAKMGRLVPLTGDLPENSADRVGKTGGAALSGIIDHLSDLMKSSESRWRNQDCVDVECIAPKTSLKPGEAVDVTATSLSKQDMSKFNSPHMKAGGTQSVTPENQAGTPSAVYTLTAPNEGTATFVVTSTSRRGIGIGLLELPVIKPKKPRIKKPVPPKSVDPIWTGTIKAVHTDFDVFEGLPNARMTRDHASMDQKWEVSLSVPGTRDLSGGIINNFHAETEVSYTGVDYKEKVYAPGEMGCGRHGAIIMTGQTQQFTIEDRGTGKATMLVGIAIYGGQGTISFGAPESIAKRHTIVKYDSACAEYNRTNSFDGMEPNPIMVGSPSFEVSFEVNPTKPDQVSGTKTVLNDEGSKTVFSWTLTRVK